MVSNLVRKLGLAIYANSLEQIGQAGQLYETAFLQETTQIYKIQATTSQHCWHIKKLSSINWN